MLTPELLLVTGKAVGTTNVLVWSDSGQTLEAKRRRELRPRAVSHAELAALFPRRRLQAHASRRTPSSSPARSSAPSRRDALRRYLEAQKVNFVDLTPLAGVQQVQVQVRMAEVSRTGDPRARRQRHRRGRATPSAARTSAGQPVLDRPARDGLRDGTARSSSRPRSISPSVTLFGGLTNGDLRALRAGAGREPVPARSWPSRTSSRSPARRRASSPAARSRSRSSRAAAAPAAGSISIEFKPFGDQPEVPADGRSATAASASRSPPRSARSRETIETTTQIGPIRTPAFLDAPRRDDARDEERPDLRDGRAPLRADHGAVALARPRPRRPADPRRAVPLDRSTRRARPSSSLLVTAYLVEPVSDLTLPPLPGRDPRRRRATGSSTSRAASRARLRDALSRADDAAVDAGAGPRPPQGSGRLDEPTARRPRPARRRRTSAASRPPADAGRPARRRTPTAEVTGREAVEAWPAQRNPADDARAGAPNAPSTWRSRTRPRSRASSGSVRDLRELAQRLENRQARRRPRSTPIRSRWRRSRRSSRSCAGSRTRASSCCAAIRAASSSRRRCRSARAAASTRTAWSRTCPPSCAACSRTSAPSAARAAASSPSSPRAAAAAARPSRSTSPTSCASRSGKQALLIDMDRFYGAMATYLGVQGELRHRRRARAARDDRRAARHDDGAVDAAGPARPALARDGELRRPAADALRPARRGADGLPRRPTATRSSTRRGCRWTSPRRWRSRAC